MPLPCLAGPVVRWEVAACLQSRSFLAPRPQVVMRQTHAACIRRAASCCRPLALIFAWGPRHQGPGPETRCWFDMAAAPPRGIPSPHWRAAQLRRKHMMQLPRHHRAPKIRVRAAPPGAAAALAFKVGPLRLSYNTATSRFFFAVVPLRGGVDPCTEAPRDGVGLHHREEAAAARGVPAGHHGSGGGHKPAP